jgi:hypothetical protein
MANPWMKKNPFLSMWLSGLNAMLGAARGQAMAATKTAGVHDRHGGCARERNAQPQAHAGVDDAEAQEESCAVVFRASRARPGLPGSVVSRRRHDGITLPAHAVTSRRRFLYRTSHGCVR